MTGDKASLDCAELFLGMSLSFILGFIYKLRQLPRGDIRKVCREME